MVRTSNGNRPVSLHWYTRVAFFAIASASLVPSLTFAQNGRSPIRDGDGAEAIATHISVDLADRDPAVQRLGVAEVRRFAIDGPLGGGEELDRVWRSWAFLKSKWFGPLLAQKQYDLIEQLARNGMTFHGREDDSGGIDSMQYCLVRALLTSGEYDKALPAAKIYYNVCKLENSAMAIDLIADALAHTRCKSAVRRFRMQQAAGASTPTDNPTLPTEEFGENLLRSIVVDAAPCKTMMENLDLPPKPPFPVLTAKGTLMLLSDQPGDARKFFDESLLHATNLKQRAAAIENIAKTIRATNGNIGGANAYILSFRQEGGL